MLKKIFIALVAIVVALLAFAATRPDSFRVERTTTIKAPPDKVFAFVGDFRQWPNWSPWEKLDPNMKRTLSGPAQGPGSVYAWTGDDKVGEGRMEILRATAPSEVDIKLEFIKPFATTNTTTFRLVPQADGTQVVWTMEGPSPFITKLMSVFVSMDTLIGKDFEAGLNNLKAAAEK